MRNRKDCEKEKLYKNVLSVVLWDHLIPVSQMHCLLYSSENLSETAQTNGFKKQRIIIMLLPQPWHLDLPHPLVLSVSPVSWLSAGVLEIPGKRGKQCHISSHTCTYTPGNILILYTNIRNIIYIYICIHINTIYYTNTAAL